MKYGESGPMSEKEKKGLAKSILSKHQPDDSKDEPDDDDMEDVGDIERMSIEPAEGGFTVETHHKPKPTKGKGDEVGHYVPPTKRIIGHEHPDAEHIRALIQKAKK